MIKEVLSKYPKATTFTGTALIAIACFLGYEQCSQNQEELTPRAQQAITQGIKERIGTTESNIRKDIFNLAQKVIVLDAKIETSSVKNTEEHKFIKDQGTTMQNTLDDWPDPHDGKVRPIKKRPTTEIKIESTPESTPLTSSIIPQTPLKLEKPLIDLNLGINTTIVINPTPLTLPLTIPQNETGAQKPKEETPQLDDKQIEINSPSVSKKPKSKPCETPNSELINKILPLLPQDAQLIDPKGAECLNPPQIVTTRESSLPVPSGQILIIQAGPLTIFTPSQRFYIPSSDHTANIVLIKGYDAVSASVNIETDFPGHVWWTFTRDFTDNSVKKVAVAPSKIAELIASDFGPPNGASGKGCQQVFINEIDLEQITDQHIKSKNFGAFFRTFELSKNQLNSQK